MKLKFLNQPSLFSVILTLFIPIILTFLVVVVPILLGGIPNPAFAYPLGWLYVLFIVFACEDFREYKQIKKDQEFQDKIERLCNEQRSKKSKI